MNTCLSPDISVDLFYIDDTIQPKQPKYLSSNQSPPQSGNPQILVAVPDLFVTVPYDPHRRHQTRHLPMKNMRAGTATARTRVIKVLGAAQHVAYLLPVTQGSLGGRLALL